MVTALAERDAVVETCERRAGAALLALTRAEGLTLAEAVERCAWDALTSREAARLRQVAMASTTPGPVKGAGGGGGTGG
ncbi:hypothetical protein Cch01nite_40520 [Cellulomonas chitinilytica]|uniref:Uncharacterized protein n=1 Tax=Cellulomonas chitinilytica TaxID=398759 RepID=A0A919P4Z0_9CELL|nr:hypothetical protein Cch01nite_40520 [Cellulomonas chitinilytica]